MDRQNIALRKTLDQIGVKHSIKGYGYIISAVEKCLENRSKLINVISGRSKVSMKKFAKVIEMIGTVVFLFCICIDATEYPVTAIPVLIGLLLIYIGTKIDGEWQEYTEEIVDYDYRSESDDDDGITYITFDTDYSKEKESSEPTKAE